MPLLECVNRNQVEETAYDVPSYLLKLEQTYVDEQKLEDNFMIQQDNLQVFKALLSLYNGQAKCMFID